MRPYMHAVFAAFTYFVPLSLVNNLRKGQSQLMLMLWHGIFRISGKGCVCLKTLNKRQIPEMVNILYLPQ